MQSPDGHSCKLAGQLADKRQLKDLSWHMLFQGKARCKHKEEEGSGKLKRAAWEHMLVSVEEQEAKLLSYTVCRHPPPAWRSASTHRRRLSSCSGGGVE